MSDMMRPLPTAPDHELHEALLVAQYAAGDPLAPDEQGKAELYVNTCGACAALAADLRGVSSAVAWEPTPSRRRDYRISPDQAEELRGGFLSRFVRRVLPQPSRTLAPTAAAVMSLGLLFVVAGSVWTDEIEFVDNAAVPAAALESPSAQQEVAPAADAVDGIRTQTDPASADEPAAAEQLGPAEEPVAAEQLGPAEELGAAEEAADAAKPEAPAVDADELLERASRESEFSLQDGAGLAASPAAQSGDDAQAFAADDLAKKALADDALESRMEAEADGEVAADDVAPDAAALEDQDGLGPDALTEPDFAMVAPEPSLGALLGATDSGVATTAAGNAAADSSTESSAAPTDGRQGDIDWLIFIGLALAVIGAASLLLAWYARRSADPLLR